MRSRVASLLVASLVALSVVGAAGTVAGADARLALTDTTVTPATPTVGAPITAATTLRLSGGSDTPMNVQRVEVRNSDGDTLGTARDLGELSPGETLTVPVSFTVNESGSYDLRLVASGRDEDGRSVEATRPLTLGVEPGAPQIQFDRDRLAAGAETSITATVSNPTTAPLRGIELSGTGSDVSVSIPTLAAGASQTVNLTVKPEAAGEQTVDVTATYTTPNGAQLETVRSKTVTVEPFSADVGIRTSVASTNPAQAPGGAGGLGSLLGGGGTGSALQSQDSGESGGDSERVDVTVTNFGNTAVDRVVLTGEDGEGARLAAVGRFAVADTLEPGESATVTVDLSNVRADDVRFVASYRTPLGTNESALVYGYNAQLGQATLTGVDVTVADDGRVTVDGNLANVGDGELTGAVVAVGESDGVSPTYPQRNYFVGTVEASSFAPFELTAQVERDNATSVPVRISYTVDGEQVTETVAVPLGTDGGGDGGQVPIGVMIAVTVGLVGVAVVTVYSRRYRRR